MTPTSATTVPSNFCFVLLPRFNMMTLTTLMEPLRIANYLAPHKLFEWDFRSPVSGEVTASNGLTIRCAGLDEGNARRPTRSRLRQLGR